MDITAKIETLKDMIMSSKRIAFLGGAGVSTESGISNSFLRHATTGATLQISSSSEI